MSKGIKLPTFPNRKIGSYYSIMNLRWNKMSGCELLAFFKEILSHYLLFSHSIQGANILVDNKGCIKLADFGASKKVAKLVNICEYFRFSILQLLSEGLIFISAAANFQKAMHLETIIHTLRKPNCCEY
jgi:serine/threonine protein kinase